MPRGSAERTIRERLVALETAWLYTTAELKETKTEVQAARNVASAAGKELTLVRRELQLLHRYARAAAMLGVAAAIHFLGGNAAEVFAGGLKSFGEALVATLS